jgi:hypothetical protein
MIEDITFQLAAEPGEPGLDGLVGLAGFIGDGLKGPAVDVNGAHQFAVGRREGVEDVAEGSGEGVFRGEGVGWVGVEGIDGDEIGGATAGATMIDEGIAGDLAEPCPELALFVKNFETLREFQEDGLEDFAGGVFIAAGEDEEVLVEAEAVEIVETGECGFIAMADGAGERGEVPRCPRWRRVHGRADLPKPRGDPAGEGRGAGFVKRETHKV